jgi:hypothetical protein
VPYHIDISIAALEHLQLMTAFQRALIMKTMQNQLRNEPSVETRNRKRMRPNPIAEWELRIRDFRVYYVVEEDPEPIVRIRGIGTKIRDQVWLGGEEVDFS